MVHEHVLESIDSEQLVVYAIWEPILPTDDEASSRRASLLIPGERTTHYWTNTKDVGRLFQAPIELTTEPAWDVYLVYPAGVRWDGSVPPAPEAFMHQLRGRLPDEKRLDGPGLAAAVRRALR